VALSIYESINWHNQKATLTAAQRLQRVVAGERSDSISSMMPGHIGDLEGVRTWPFGKNRGVEGNKRPG